MSGADGSSQEVAALQDAPPWWGHISSSGVDVDVRRGAAQRLRPSDGHSARTGARPGRHESTCPACRPDGTLWRRRRNGDIVASWRRQTRLPWLRWRQRGWRRRTSAAAATTTTWPWRHVHDATWSSLIKWRLVTSIDLSWRHLTTSQCLCFVIGWWRRLRC